ncbi:MAG TPA: sulfotransferase [Sphingobium sp.]|uniref:tetratricopeptide repeat-containing sulfotransferase family protein n=1 Tax=Sphingobium sp. TaxID=1912891 RepID=UPI002ED0A97F
MSDMVTVDAAADAVAPAALCDCGSGLRQLNCCGLDLRQVKPVPAEGEQAERVVQMMAAYREDDRGTARRIAIDLLEAAPGQRDALGMLYNVHKDGGQIRTAAILIDRLAHLHANDAMIRLLATQFFLSHGDLMRAQRHVRMLIRLAPLSGQAQFAMGRVFQAVGKATAAEYHLRNAMRLSGTGEAPVPASEMAVNLALSLRDQGLMEDARTLFRDVVDEHGDTAAVLIQWASLEEMDRRFEAAAALLERAATMSPGDPQVGVAMAALKRRVADPEGALGSLASIRREEDGQVAAAELLQKGQILDSMGRYDEAFAQFDAAKARLRERSGHGYGADRAKALVTGLTEFFTAERTAMLPRAELRPDSPQPIFIVGFPRSGTTLIEQTLTSHPQIAAGDELPMINMIVERAQALLGSPLPYPGALSELWLGDRATYIRTLRDLYLNEAVQIGAIDPARRWFTDKMPLNETHLGLVSLLFPRSPIIHLVRHPLDVVLSVFSNGLTHGFFCSYALESAAQHYALIADLIAHYRAAMPLHYHAVRYEDFVVDQEAQVRALLQFIGEPYDAAALDFHENRRAARTASYAQVTEPLYTRSRFRYRHYIEHLRPVLPILEPAIRRLGYSVEGF